MKKATILALALLSGCSLNPDAAKQYAAEKRLDAVITAADNRIEVQTSEQAAVSVFYWEEGGQPVQLDVQTEGNGLFSVDYSLPAKGIYYVKADIQTESQHIFPTKKIAIGEQADLKPDKPAAPVEAHH